MWVGMKPTQIKAFSRATLLYCNLTYTISISSIYCIICLFPYLHRHTQWIGIKVYTAPIKDSAIGSLTILFWMQIDNSLQKSAVIHAVICGMRDKVAVPYPSPILIGFKDIVFPFTWRKCDRIRPHILICNLIIIWIDISTVPCYPMECMPMEM